MTNLYYNYYVPKDTSRKAEIDFCFKMLQANKYIDNYYIIVSDTDVSELELQLKKDVTLFIYNNRPTYKFIYDDICRRSNIDDINIMINSDCFLEEQDMLNLSKLEKDVAWCITRYNILDNQFNVRLHSVPHWSQDCWIFKNTYPVNNIDFSFGVPGCDNRFAHELNVSGYNVLNAYISLRVYHYHMQETRNYIGNVPPPYYFITESI